MPTRHLQGTRSPRETTDRQMVHSLRLLSLLHEQDTLLLTHARRLSKLGKNKQQKYVLLFLNTTDFLSCSDLTKTSCPPADGQRNRLWYIHAMEHFENKKHHLLLTHATARMDFNNITHKAWHPEWLHLHVMSRKGKSRETKSKLAVAKSWGTLGGNGKGLVEVQGPFPGWESGL